MMNPEKMIDFNETKMFLTELIKINSVTGNEKPLAVYVANKFRLFGAEEVRLQHVDGEQYNVIATVKGERPGKTILLTGHMDTVPSGDFWTCDPFGGEEKDGRIYGRGSNDMKAGIAVILETIKIAAAHRKQLPGNIVVALVSDEEAYSAGIIKLLEEIDLQADFGIAAEPEYHQALVGAAGKTLIKVTVTGKAAHAASPQCGCNAVEEGARFLAALNQLPICSHVRMGSQPYVTLKIEGGFKEYSVVVPAQCQILINKHTVPGETPERILNDMNELVKRLGLKAKFEFTIERPYYPPYEIDLPNQDLERLKTLFFEVTGQKLGITYGDGVCDNNHIVPVTDIPVVNFGPSGGGIHSYDEWVDLQQMENVLKIYLRFIFCI